MADDSVRGPLDPELIDAVLAELRRLVENLDPRFRQLAEYRPYGINPDMVPGTGGPGFTPHKVPKGDLGFSWDCLMKAFESWKTKAAAAGDVGTLSTLEGAIDWIFVAAKKTKTRDVSRPGGPGYGGKMGDVPLSHLRDDGTPVARPSKEQERTLPADPRQAATTEGEKPKKKTRRALDNPASRGQYPGAAPDELENPELGAPAPLLTIAGWALSEKSGERHVFRFEPQQGAVFGAISRVLSRGYREDEAMVLAKDEGVVDPRRKWRDGARRAREMLYIIGALGTRGALRDVSSLDEAVAALDVAFDKQWKGPDLTLLKAVSRNAEKTDDGFARMRPALLQAFLESDEAAVASAQKAARKALDALRTDAPEADVSIVHGSESLVATVSHRPDPLCILNPECAVHPATREDR